MSRKSVNDVFVIGFAMFAMFFGAGNLIFPPYLGLISGGNWGIGFICFMLMDMGLSIFTLVVVAKIGKGAEGITEVLGRIPSKVILAVNAICLGPVIAIPRTAATAYEFSIEPF
ncbi:MAG: branched-chain amino acid transport system II carrier protein, partial [Frisingicoccus sp.]|uniref:branched-chain amino acid transport system II carrier protein n=1 Tax=Frisingicoccus sp. TaxID=1918627 RepID=UPI002615F433